MLQTDNSITMRPSDISDYLRMRRLMKNPWAFIRLRNRAGSKESLQIILKDGVPFRLRPQDHSVFYGVFGRDEYRLNEAATTSLDIVIDVGAHIGSFAVRVAPRARRVLCYEPMPENYELLTQNLSPFPQAEPRRLAVAGRRGTAEIFIGKTLARNSLFHRQERHTRGSITVQTTTLADIFAEHGIDHCDLLKLDCEGAEYEILYGSPRDLLTRIRRICMEYHSVAANNGSWNGEALVSYLRTVGHQAVIYPSPGRPERGIILSALRQT